MSALNLRKSSVYKVGLRASSLAMYLFLYSPILVVFLLSFESRAPGQTVTYEYYVSLAQSETLLNSLYLSVRIALVVMVLSTILATMAAFGLGRFEWPEQKLTLTGYIVSPMLLPIIVYAIALFIVINKLGLGRGPVMIVLGHIVYTLPFATVVMLAGVNDFDRRLEEAAMDLGADRFTTVREITLPLLKPSLLAAALFSFTLSWDEFLIAFFVGGNNATLPVRIWGRVRRNLSPEIYAISVVVMVISILLASMATRLE